ncbi:MAG: hypothetical protein ACLTSG_08545 [Lachnospiraceae bacterium]
MTRARRTLASRAAASRHAPSRGSLLFHPGREFHALWATGDSAPNPAVELLLTAAGEPDALIGDEVYTCGRSEAERARGAAAVSERERRRSASAA